MSCRQSQNEFCIGGILGMMRDYSLRSCSLAFLDSKRPRFMPQASFFLCLAGNHKINFALRGFSGKGITRFSRDPWLSLTRNDQESSIAGDSRFLCPLGNHKMNFALPEGHKKNKTHFRGSRFLVVSAEREDWQGRLS